MNRTLAALALCTIPALAPLASAAPLAFTHQARVLDAAGLPLTGTHPVRFAIYASADAATPIWEETAPLLFENGLLSHVLGSVTPLEADDFDGQTRYLGLSVGDEAELSPRVPVVSVPYALRALRTANADFADVADRADVATSVAGGVVDASEIRINGSVVIDGSGVVSAELHFDDLVGLPADLSDGDDDTLADLACADGQIARYTGGAWGCADLSVSGHVHDASEITTGTLAIGRLPVGTGPNTVKAGDAPDADTLASLPCTTGQVAQKTDSGWECATPLTSGTLVVSDPGAPCDAAREGLLRWSAGALQVCDGAGWLVLGRAGLGTSEASPGASCYAIKQAAPSSGDGVYWLRIGSNAAFEAWCDMTTEGGGWTLVSQGIPVSNVAQSLCSTGAVGELDLVPYQVSRPAKLSDAAINGLWATGPGRELLVKQAREVLDGNATAWTQVCRADFVNSHTWTSAAGGSALAQLQTANITCSPGSSWTANAVWNGQYCGYSFENASAARYLIYSVNSTYSGGTCGTANAGRSWTQEGNWGCNTTRTFIR